VAVESFDLFLLHFSVQWKLFRGLNNSLQFCYSGVQTSKASLKHKTPPVVSTEIELVRKVIKREKMLRERGSCFRCLLRRL